VGKIKPFIGAYSVIFKGALKFLRLLKLKISSPDWSLV
jgi:hypothetical protein